MHFFILINHLLNGPKYFFEFINRDHNTNINLKEIISSIKNKRKLIFNAICNFI